MFGCLSGLSVGFILYFLFVCVLGGFFVLLGFLIGCWVLFLFCVFYLIFSSDGFFVSMLIVCIFGGF